MDATIIAALLIIPFGLGTVFGVAIAPNRKKP